LCPSHPPTQFLIKQYSQLLEPLRPTSKPSARRLQELLACHKRFCEQQLANKKTSRVLEAAFDAEFTQQYMEQVCLASLCKSFLAVVRCIFSAFADASDHG
jgi:hypothetical protein